MNNNNNNNIIITTIKGDWPFKRTALLLNTSWWLAANQSAGLFWSRLLLRVSWHVEGKKKKKKKTANRNPTCDCFQRSAQLIGSCCYRVDVPTQLLGSIWRWAVYCQGNKQTRRWHVWISVKYKNTVVSNVCQPHMIYHIGVVLYWNVSFLKRHKCLLYTFCIYHSYL